MVDKNKIAMEILGSSAGFTELRRIGIAHGLVVDKVDIDLQVAIICEAEGVWNCQVCNWWYEESEMHNEICNDCYAEDHDE